MVAERTLPEPTRGGGIAAEGARLVALSRANRAAGINRHGMPGTDDDLALPCLACDGARYVRRPLTVGPLGEQQGGEIIACAACMTAPSRAEILARCGLAPEATMTGWVDVPELTEARRALDALVAGERWIVVLRGGTGRGKTRLARVAGVRWLDERGTWPAFANVPDLLDRLRDCFERDATSTLSALLERYTSAALLILDDLGAERGTEWAREQLYKLIDARSRAELPLIVTSNTRHSAEAAELGERIVSRLAPGEIVIRNGRDFRRTAQ